MFGRKKHTFVMIFSLLISSYILSDENYALVSNNLIDGKSDQIRNNLAVIISNNKISQVIDRNLVPKDIRLIDLGTLP